ncbi:hypothetical protein SAMN05216559_3018 [Halomicrobium zhouii]|uniref:Uncharacterized protein n=1 Tax=Halomicrobium zhouii TaxID=767519 RepID=A0A1I6LS64_9EURY|nr:DUF5793 family protein [Halomicrobium zhouii]SFS06335.1 hypothetical protein SAMN05216559_3018 [Halomicrobium zhouii]
MRRDYFDANVDDDEQDRPVIAIAFDGPDGLLSERLETEDGPLESSEIDVTYRLTNGENGTDENGTGDDETTRGGVLSVANRLTGEFVLEVRVDPGAVSDLVRASKETDGEDGSRYRLRLVDAEGNSTVYDKGTLLVYDADGSLLRQRSLIPGGVEL